MSDEELGPFVVILKDRRHERREYHLRERRADTGE